MSARTYLTHEIVLRVPPNPSRTQHLRKVAYASRAAARTIVSSSVGSVTRSVISLEEYCYRRRKVWFRLRLLWWCPACSFCLFFSLSAAGRTMQLRDIPARLLAARRVFSWFRFGFALVRDVEVDVPAPVCGCAVTPKCF